MKDDMTALRTEIRLREAQAARLVARHEPPGRVYEARRGIVTLYDRLREAEKEWLMSRRSRRG